MRIPEKVECDKCKIKEDFEIIAKIKMPHPRWLQYETNHGGCVHVCGDCTMEWIDTFKESPTIKEIEEENKKIKIKKKEKNFI